MKTFALILISLVLIGCVAPSRLGVRYKGEEIVHPLNSTNNQNQNITISVNPLTNEDIPIDIEVLRNKIETYVHKNADLEELIKKYPDLKINMEVMPHEKIDRTWLLDIAFFYPGLGCLLPYTPWWGNVKLDAKLTISVPNRISDDFQFSTVEPFTINSYPYYRAGKILTTKYSFAYDHIFEQLKAFDFSEFAEKVDKIMPEASISRQDSQYINTTSAQSLNSSATVKDVNGNVNKTVKTGSEVKRTIVSAKQIGEIPDWKKIEEEYPEINKFSSLFGYGYFISNDNSKIKSIGAASNGIEFVNYIDKNCNTSAKIKFIENKDTLKDHIEYPTVSEIESVFPV